MSARGFARLCWLVAVIVVFVSPVQAQQSNATALSKAQLEQLVAPVALHPDALLSQMLMASTYPTEVVQAARWIRENPGLSGQALEDALQNQPWDPSIKALAAVPQSLQMMNDKLDWTQRLGDAFLAQQENLLAAVQGLRQRAEASGNLNSSEHVKISRSPASPTGGPATNGQGPAITIVSATPDYMYVPVYDPRVSYGDWPYSDYDPFYWYPEGYAGSGVRWAAGIAIGAAIWGNADWWRGRVDIDVDRYNRFNRTNIVNREWNHNPRHRGNVPYRDAHVAQRFGDGNRAAAREAFSAKAEAGRSDLATKAGAAAAGAAAVGAAAKAKAGAAAKSRPAATPAKHAGKAKSAAKTKSAANTNRSKGAKSAHRAAGSKHASQTRHASRPRAATHRPQAQVRSPVRHAQRHAYRPSMGARGGGFRASGFRGGGFGGGGFRGGGGRGGGRRSDVALKHDIVLLARLDNGVGFYRFAYNGSNQAYVGVLAQEVQKVRPEAVMRGSDGYLRVHYDQLGLKFQTYRQWTASGAQIPGR